MSVLPAEITDLVRVPAETMAATETQSNWSSPETGKNRRFSHSIALAYKRAEPSNVVRFVIRVVVSDREVTGPIQEVVHPVFVGHGGVRDHNGFDDVYPVFDRDRLCGRPTNRFDQFLEVVNQRRHVSPLVAQLLTFEAKIIRCHQKPLLSHVYSRTDDTI